MWPNTCNCSPHFLSFFLNLVHNINMFYDGTTKTPPYGRKTMLRSWFESKKPATVT